MGPALVVTGFGPFHGIEDNPSQWLVEQLQREADEDSSQHEDVTYEVLEVSAEYVRKRLAALAQNFSADQEVISVHMGVHGSADCFRLESQAFNEASFRVADEAGWQPENQAIDPRHSTSHRLQSDLPLGRLAEELRPQHDVKVSYDAGRFVCNYTEYLALQQAQQTASGHWHAFFLHVPRFDAIKPRRQLDFAHDLLQLLRCDPMLSDGTPRDGEAEGNGLLGGSSSTHKAGHDDGAGSGGGRERQSRWQRILRGVSMHRLQTVPLLLLGWLCLKS